MKRNNNLNRLVLKNKISNNLILLGKNCIIELFDKYYQNFETIILPDKSNSKKLQLIIQKARSKHISLVNDSELLSFVEGEISARAGAIVLLKRKIEKSLSLRDIKSILQNMDKCTVLAIPELDYEQNLGSVIRTSLALGVDFLLISNRQQKVFSLTVTKVSMGYNYVLPIVQENFLLAIDELKNLGFDILGLDMKGENILDFSYNPKVCFIAGNEGKGLSEVILKKCTKTLSIPMNGGVESLNVSTSAGIILFDRLSKLNK